MDTIKLYHISYNEDDSLCKEFIPRVPNNLWINEDKTTARICLCDSIEHCFNALPELPRVSSNSNAATVVIYEKEFNTNDKKLIHWQELYEKDLVPDVALTHEYWYIGSLTMRGEKFQIIIDDDHDIPHRECKYIVPAKLKPLLIDIINKHRSDIDLNTVKKLDPSTILNEYLPQALPPATYEIIYSDFKKAANNLSAPVQLESLRTYSNIIYKRL